jgi:hypothetical protein
MTENQDSQLPPASEIAQPSPKPETPKAVKAEKPAPSLKDTLSKLIAETNGGFLMLRITEDTKLGPVVTFGVYESSGDKRIVGYDAFVSHVTKGVPVADVSYEGYEGL